MQYIPPGPPLTKKSTYKVQFLETVGDDMMLSLTAASRGPILGGRVRLICSGH